jgi:hypothetical protein
MSTKKGFKRKIKTNQITSGMIVYDDMNIYDTAHDDDEVEFNFDNHEKIEGLDILIDYAQWDIGRSKKLLVKAEDNGKLYEKLVKHLKICRKAYVKVLSYSYQMAIVNASPEIDYASEIGNAVSIDFTNIAATTASLFANTTTDTPTQDATKTSTD